MEFEASKSNLKAVHCQIKSVNLEVAFTMLTKSGTSRTYCATPDIEEKMAEVVATGEAVLYLGYNKKTMKELMYSGPAGVCKCWKT